jgi:hypothetical protein
MSPADRLVSLLGIQGRRPELGPDWLALAEQLEARAFVEASEACVEQAVSVAPQDAQVLCRAAGMKLQSGAFLAAESLARRALEVEPGSAFARSQLALCYLAQGRYEEGWPLADYRLHGHVGLPLEALERWPRWRGGSPAGRRLLVVGEQGHGDRIQFARYAEPLASAGARVDFAFAGAPLAGLLRSVPGLEAVHEDAPASGEYDSWIPILSLPGALGTRLATIPARVPYLAPAAERSRRWAPPIESASPPGALRIGVAWAGRPTHVFEHWRSIALSALAPLWSVGGCTWFSLQAGDAAPPVSGSPLVDLGRGFRDFEDTAAAITALDLVISVDTAVAHLAGALGKPVWLLLPSRGVDWRWMAGRTDSPWYPTMRLFRQSRPGDWAPVVAQLRERLPFELIRRAPR